MQVFCTTLYHILLWFRCGFGKALQFSFKRFWWQTCVKRYFDKFLTFYSVTQKVCITKKFLICGVPRSHFVTMCPRSVLCLLCWNQSVIPVAKGTAACSWWTIFYYSSLPPTLPMILVTSSTLVKSQKACI